MNFDYNTLQLLLHIILYARYGKIINVNVDINDSILDSRNRLITIIVNELYSITEKGWNAYNMNSLVA